MKRFLFLSCMLALASAVYANSPSSALTAQQISDQASAESKSLQIIERQTDGRVRMTVPMQAMEALIGPVGMKLRSINAGGDAAFGWRLEAVGRADSLHALADLGEVIIEGERVAVLCPQAIEEFTASADGIRQDFIISSPPPTGEGSEPGHPSLGKAAVNVDIYGRLPAVKRFLAASAMSGPKATVSPERELPHLDCCDEERVC